MSALSDLRNSFKQYNGDRLCYVYKITNVIENKVYVGSTHNLYSRWSDHVKDLQRGKGHGRLQMAWTKDGLESFRFDAIQPIVNFDNLREIEQGYIDLYKSTAPEFGYNTKSKAVFCPLKGTPPKPKIKRSRALPLEEKRHRMYLKGLKLKEHYATPSSKIRASLANRWKAGRYEKFLNSTNPLMKPLLITDTVDGSINRFRSKGEAVRFFNKRMSGLKFDRHIKNGTLYLKRYKIEYAII